MFLSPNNVCVQDKLWANIAKNAYGMNLQGEIVFVIILLGKWSVFAVAYPYGNIHKKPSE